MRDTHNTLKVYLVSDATYEMHGYELEPKKKCIDNPILKIQQDSIRSVTEIIFHRKIETPKVSL